MIHFRSRSPNNATEWSWATEQMQAWTRFCKTESKYELTVTYSSGCFETLISVHLPIAKLLAAMGHTLDDCKVLSRLRANTLESDMHNWFTGNVITTPQRLIKMI